MLMKMRAFLVCLSLGLLLWGCSSPKEEPGSYGAGGPYKVGKPYKINNVWYYPEVNYSYDETGIASWYGPNFHGKKTANGETYDQWALTAAHTTLPMPTMVQVTNLENGKSIKLRINDRGPYHNGRIIDVSRKGAELLGFKGKGTARVRVTVIEDESRRLAALAQSGGQVQTAKAPQAAPVGSVAVESLQAPGSTSPSSSQQVAVAQSSGSIAVTDSVPKPTGEITLQPVYGSRLYVQTGSFSQWNNAAVMANRLRSHGPVRIAEAKVGGRDFFRVQVGPMQDVNAADAMLDRLLDSGFMDSRVIVVQ